MKPTNKYFLSLILILLLFFIFNNINKNGIYKASYFEVKKFESSIKNNNIEKCIEINKMAKNKIVAFGNIETYSLRTRCIEEIAIQTKDELKCEYLNDALTLKHKEIIINNCKEKVRTINIE